MARQVQTPDAKLSKFRAQDYIGEDQVWQTVHMCTWHPHQTYKANTIKSVSEATWGEKALQWCARDRLLMLQ